MNRNWNKFLKIDGSNEVKMQSGLWPEIVVKNEYDEALNNPQIDIYFTDFGIKGRDGTEKSWGGRTIQWTFLQKNGQGISQHVSIKLNGTILGNDYEEIGLFGQVDKYFLLGSSPSAKIILTLENGKQIISNINIVIL